MVDRQWIGAHRRRRWWRRGELAVGPAAVAVLLLGGCGGEEEAAPGERAGGEPRDSVAVRLFVVALETVQPEGGGIGCGDTLVALDRRVPVRSESSGAPPSGPAPEIPVKVRSARAAVEALIRLGELAREDQGPPGPAGDLYNALARSRLSVEEVALHGPHAEVRLSGRLGLGGVCDAPRVEAQLEETVRAASGAADVDIYLNGEPLQASLSGRGR